MRLSVSAVLRSFVFLSAAFFPGCLFDQGLSYWRVPDAAVGTLYRSNGKPAAHARVQVFPVSHLPRPDGRPEKDSIYSTIADADGRYRIAPMPAGKYNVLADLDGEFAYRDSVLLSAAASSPTYSDTLTHPGSLVGTVVLQPNHDPRSAVVQVLGTYIYSNVDSAGMFRLDSLAGGAYFLRVTTTEGAYTPLYFHWQAKPGDDDTLTAPLSPSFTGIPVVTGVQAAYDTLGGIVRLSWNPIAYRNFSEYLIFRDTALALTLSGTPIAGTSDTVFRDSLYLPSSTSRFDPRDTLDHTVEYRVVARSKSDSLGATFGAVRVAIIPPTKVRTSIAFLPPVVRWDSAARADSIQVVVAASNPTRGLARILWRIGDDSIPARKREWDRRKSAEDTLRFGWKAEGPVIVHAQVEDEAGTLRRDSLIVPGNRAPVLGGTPVVQAKNNVPYRFTPTATDPDGDSLTFKADNLPPWAAFDSRTGTLSGTPKSADTGLYAGIRISVADGRRSDTLPPFSIRVAFQPWSVRQAALNNVEGGFAVSIGGELLVFRDWYIPGRAVDRYNPATDTWSQATVLPENCIVHGAYLIGDRVYLILSPNVNPPTDFYVRSYDPAANSWANEGPIPLSRSSFGTAASNGKIYFFGGGKALVEEYDPKTHALASRTPSPRVPSDLMTVAAAGDRIYLVGDADASAKWIPDSMMVYEPATDTWSLHPAMPSKRVSVGACASGGKLYAVGGFLPPETRFPVPTLEVYDPLSRTWTAREDMPTPRIKPVCGESRGNLYFIGGMGGFDAPPDTPLANEEYEPVR